MADTETGEKPPIPEEYSESDCETQTVRNTGACLWILLGLCTISWIFHAFPVMGTTDTPAFAKSLIWSSIAHHTDVWQNAMNAFPPPPPSFGDGSGNYPSDRLLRM